MTLIPFANFLGLTCVACASGRRNCLERFSKHALQLSHVRLTSVPIRADGEFYRLLLVDMVIFGAHPALGLAHTLELAVRHLDYSRS